MREASSITRRTLLAGAFGAAASFALSGCSGSTSSASASSSASSTVTVTDCVGRSVQVPANPQRVAGLDSFVGELMVMIGAGPLLVGTPGGVVTDQLLQAIFPQLASVPAPMQNGTINMEEYLAASPEVALIKQDIYETAGQAEQLDGCNVPYVVVGYAGMTQQIAMMRLVGQVCGGEYQQRAEALAALYEQTIADCAARVAGIPDDQRLRVYHAINALTMTDGTTSLGADWIAAAGGIDVSAQDPEAATATDYTTTLEQIFDWDPDAIICNSADSTDYLLTKDACAGLRAVQLGACYTIPVGATRWGQRGSVETYLAMLWMGKTLYPDAYADVDLQEYVTDYYADYLGLQIDDATYDLIISGRGIRQESTDAANQK